MSINLDEKINIIYDFLHNKTLTTCYEIKKINIKNINSEDIMIPKSNLASNLCKQLLVNNIQYFDNINDDLYFKSFSDNFTSLIKISINNKNYNDALISYILSELVLRKQTKHILLPIINFKIDINEIKKLIEIKSNKVSEKILKNKICCINIKENFYKIYTLNNYITKFSINWKIILFQILHTLLIIKSIYPYFQHNRLTLNNIFVYQNKNFDDMQNYIYEYNDKKFIIKNTEYEIKITNFENSIISKNDDIIEDTIEDTIDNSIEEDIDDILEEVSTDTVENTVEDSIEDIIENIIDTKNKINELVDFFTIIKDIKNKNINLDFETKNFLNKIIELNKMKKYSLVNFLDDPYFSEFDENNKIVEKKILGTRELKSELNSNKSELYNNKKIIQKKYKREIRTNYNTILLSDNENILGNQNKINKENKINHFENIRKLKDINLVGGANVETPFKHEKNTPFLTNDEKNTFKKRNAENPPKEPPILLQQTIYDTNKNQPSKQEPPPAYVPVYDSTGQVISGMPQIGPNPTYSQPFQKLYNINLANPIGNYTSINKVFEDILPGDPRSLTFSTLYERHELIKWMRSIILEINDGEEMDITGGKNSLLSFIKLMDLNPYSLSDNPYKELAYNFMLYRAAYPIRYEKHNLQAANNSIGINVRIYNMSLGEVRAETINNNINRHDFNLWREIDYYKFIKTDIVNKKISPNFITYILYKTDSKSNIQWNQLAITQKKHQNNNELTINESHTLQDYNSLYSSKYSKNFKITIKYINTNNTFYNNLLEKLKNYSNLDLDVVYIDPSDPINVSILFNYKIKKYPTIILEYEEDGIHIINKYKGNYDVNDFISFIETDILNKHKLDITTTSGKSLILLTEAPNSSFIKWASSIYASHGSIKKMVSTGYHSNDVWKSILFQMIYILTVLQEKEIYFNELSLENNFYIKDLFANQNNLTYWIYNINDFNYYIPNYGYIVLFDSKYSDIVSNIETTKYKIYSETIYKNKNDDTFKNLNVKDFIYHKFKELIDTTNFNSKLKALGGLPPSNEIIDFIDSIWKDTDSTFKITNIFPKYFNSFFNNKIGTILMKSEKENINILNRPNLKSGNMIIYRIRHEEYIWVMFDSSINNRQHYIWIKNNDTFQKITVNEFNLFGYLKTETIMPDKIPEENVIERYNL